MKVPSFFISVLFLAFAVAFSACGTKLAVQKATVQAWNGGVEGSGGGKNYRVYIQKPKSKAITIEQVWLGDREKGWRMRYSVVNFNGDSNMQSIAEKGFTEFIVVFTEIRPAAQGINMPNSIVPLENAPKDLPENFSQGLAIYYSDGKHSGIWVIEDFVTLPTLNYP